MFSFALKKLLLGKISRREQPCSGFLLSLIEVKNVTFSFLPHSLTRDLQLDKRNQASETLVLFISCESKLQIDWLTMWSSPAANLIYCTILHASSHWHDSTQFVGTVTIVRNPRESLISDVMRDGPGTWGNHDITRLTCLLENPRPLFSPDFTLDQRGRPLWIFLRFMSSSMDYIAKSKDCSKI